MTIEPQTDAIAALTGLQATLEQAKSEATGAKAAVMAVLAQPPVDVTALQAELTAVKIELANQTLYKEGWRNEAWGWRKLEGGTYDLYKRLTPEEVAAKKLTPRTLPK